MEVIHILKGKANPNTMNGVNKVVHHLATEQCLLGVDAQVWGITATPHKTRHQHSYPLRLFPATRSRFLPCKSLRTALSSLQGERVIVHLHSVFLPELFGVSRILKKHHIPWVLSPHNGYAPRSMKKNGWVKAVFLRLFDRRIISGAAKLHAIGESEVVDLKKLASEKVVVLIPNGQSMEEVRFTPIPDKGPSQRPVFGFCGRLASETKGLDLLIEGFSKYKRNGGLGELWLIGDGPDKKCLQELARKTQVRDSVIFFGPLFGDAKLICLSTMDVFVHTSRWEGMPMAALEAAALGKPLLVSKETNMGKYLLKYGNGILLENNTSEIIASALCEFYKLHDSSQEKMMRENSIKLIQNELNWPTIAKSMVEKLYIPPEDY